MSEAIKKEYIPKKDKGSGEYEDLYIEGIELLQKLSGAQWTDYNEHDPGVTILENIAYTLTDLSYKTSQPIKDILVESKGGGLESGDNGFFIPSDILTTNPVTVNDFRKVFIDRITNVKNVWIETQNQEIEKINHQTQKKLKGLYHIFIEMYNYSSDPVELKNEENRITGEVRELFHAHRNLCEDIYNVTIFKPFQIHMKMKLMLGHVASGEDVFANIFFKVGDYLTHDVRFYSLWELQKRKEDINTIFNGPSLENGFISDDELKSRSNHIVPSEIMKIVAKEEGVISIDFFELSYEKEEGSGQTELVPITEEGFWIPENCSPVLVFPKENTNLFLEQGGVKFFPDLTEVQKQLSYIQVMNYGSFKSVSQAFNTIKIPEGQSLNLASYYPLREQFPVYYGIGEYGLPNDLPVSRYAQANQLKAYLLPFDQLMTNFLAQLTGLYHIFDANTKKLHSYFYQELEDMPELVELIKATEHESKEESLNTWSETLRTLNNRFDSIALQRLNEVADHLLARYSEQFPTYSLKKIHINCYGKKLTSQKFEDELLEWKRTLIANYGQLSYNRAKAFDYTQKLDLTDSDEVEISDSITPGIVQKTAILMGIKNYKTRFLTKVIAESGIKIYQKKEGLGIISEKLEIVYSKSDIDVITVDDIVIIDETVENLRDSFYYLGNSGSILKDVLRNGVQAENYEIKQTENNKKNAYYVLYKGGKQPSVAHIADSEQEAKQAIDRSVNYLVDLNQKSEGLYLVEHILLAPPYHGDYFGFAFSIPMQDGKEVEFIQAKLQSNGGRNTCVNNVVSNLIGKGTLQLRVIGKGDKYVIHILTKAGETLAVTSNTYDDKQSTQQDIDNIVKQLYTFKEGQFNDKVNYYAYYGENKVDETFFSFQMSMIMPSWPVRFQDNNFRAKFENVIYEQAPIHIVFQSYWLDLMDMADFEKDYYKWLGFVYNNDYPKEQMSHAYDLITKIQHYYQENN